MNFFRNINWTNSLCKKVGLGLACALLFVLALTTHSPKASADDKDSDSSSAADESSQIQQAKYDTVYVKVENETVKNTGLLVLDNKDHRYSADGADFAFIYQYLFNAKGEQIMSTSSTGVCGTKEMMEHLNSMVSDFASQTGLKTLMVTNASYQADGKLYMTQYDVPDAAEKQSNDGDEKKTDTDKGSVSSNGCYEHLSGLAVDFQLYEADNGTYPEYTGDGQYAWINENCWRYGFVLRYPADKQEATGVAEKKNHYRYVGNVYAQIMHENNLALEELYAFLNKYTYEKPLTVNSPDGAAYIVYSTVLEKDKTSTSVPTPSNPNGGSSYQITSVDGERVYIFAPVGSAQLQQSAPTESSSQAQ